MVWIAHVKLSIRPLRGCTGSLRSLEECVNGGWGRCGGAALQINVESVPLNVPSSECNIAYPPGHKPKQYDSGKSNLNVVPRDHRRGLNS